MGNRVCSVLSLFCILVLLFEGSNCRYGTEPVLTPPPPGKPDTTSHIVSWIVDSLGTQGVSRDVWAFSRDSAIAVGQILLPDSNGVVTGENPYACAWWNGKTWRPVYLTYLYSEQAFVLSEVHGIWVSPNGDFWISAGRVWHWDGVSPQAQLRFDNLSLPTRYAGVEKLWGASNNNIFGVGNAGTIVHFDGTNWTQMTSGTTVDLQDVWGLDGSHVWVTGSNVGDGHSITLRYDGTSWSKLYDNTGQTPLMYFNFSSVWTYDETLLYLTGGSQLRVLQEGKYTQIETGGQYVSYRVRGINQNDIFTTGQGSEVTHYNGVSWYLYPELKALNGGYSWFYNVHAEKDFVLIGGLSLTSLNSYPIVVRGYR